ncbi:MAG: asparaginase [Solirubrobacteraceae bacterium]|nr:asparaginase [Solirubrobacteraceae bacterium]
MPGTLKRIPSSAHDQMGEGHTRPPEELGSPVIIEGSWGFDRSERILLLNAGGTIGMGPSFGGALAPLPATELVAHARPRDDAGFGVTFASFRNPLDSSRMRPKDWVDIADAIVALAPGHTGVVVLHGTDTLAFTASALSFMLAGVDRPIVLTGAQRPIVETRSDAPQNLTTACVVASPRTHELPVVPEVCVWFYDRLLRGNRTSKVDADSYEGFASPNFPPLGQAGVALKIDETALRPARHGPLRRVAGVCTDVAAVRLHPALDAAALDAILSRPGLRGAVIEAYGSGNGPTEPEFLAVLSRAADAGVVVVITTQCGAGTVRQGYYAAGAEFFSTGAVSGLDLTFESAITKLMVLLDQYPADRVRELMGQPVAGELTPID